MTEVEKVLDKQSENLLKAYEDNNVRYSYLPTLLERSRFRKGGVFRKYLGKDLTHVFTREKTREEIDSDPFVVSLRDAYSEYSLSFKSWKYTNKSTGHCYDLDNIIDFLQRDRLKEALKPITCVISADPLYLLGCSVINDGKQLDKSCHYPTIEGDYCSGPISYAFDSHTILCAELDSNRSIKGRMLVHYSRVDDLIITMRKYGKIGNVEKSFVPELGKLFEGEFFAAPEFSHTINYEKDDFMGYIDDGYSRVYTKEKNFQRRDEQVEIELCLEAPVCLNCGDYHAYESILCKTCNKETVSCDCCGETIYEDDSRFVRNLVICENCYDNRAAECRNCETIMLTGEIYTLEHTVVEEIENSVGEIELKEVTYIIEGCAGCLGSSSYSFLAANYENYIIEEI